MPPATTRPPSPTLDAVRHILNAPQFDADRDVIDRNAGPDWWDFGQILSQWPWSHGQQTTLEVAWAIFNGGGDALLSDVIAQLDRDLQVRVLQALRIRLDLPAGEAS